MHTRTRADFLAPWRQSLLSPSDNVLWQSYVDQFKPYYRPLVDFVEDQAVRNDAMKARALVVLLAPDEAQVPLYWKRDSSSSLNCLDVGTANLKGLSPELLRLVAAIIVVHNPDLRERLQHEERAAYAPLRHYGDYIRQLLSLMPVEEAEGVFACYNLNDPGVFQNMDDASGYRPYEWLMSNIDIPEVWKARADEAMQAIVLEELRGKRFARAPHEWALQCYVNATIGHSQVRQLRYSVSLLARQVAFILEHSRADSDALGWYQTPSLLHQLSGEEYGQLRGRLAQFRWQQLRQSESGLYSEDGLAEAQMLLAELKANSLPFDELEGRIENSRPKIEKMAAQAAREKASREAIMRQMRGE